MAESTALGRYACPYCEARFRSVGDKRRHLKVCEEAPGA